MLCAGEFSVRRVRVLVANHPRLMRELVLATIADQPDIEVVGEVQNEGELAEIVEQVLPDVLIIAINKYFLQFWATEATAASRSSPPIFGYSETGATSPLSPACPPTVKAWRFRSRC